MNLYLISGLSADERAFSRMTFPAHYTVRYLPHLGMQRRESIPEYAQRMAAGIDTTQPFALAGLSLGGMIASEISTFLRPEKTVLISSAGAGSELPPLLRALGRCRVNRIFPTWLVRRKHALVWWLLGVTTREEKQLYADMLALWSDAELENAIDAILNWQRTERPPGVLQIHGDADRTLPLRHTRADVVVPGGGHLMLFSQAEEVSAGVGRLLKG